MSKRQKPRQTVRPRKRGAKARPAITGDPQTPSALLRKQDRDLKGDFDAADKEGKEALKRRDLPALTDAIRREGHAIEEHVRLTGTSRRK